MPPFKSQIKYVSLYNIFMKRFIFKILPIRILALIIAIYSYKILTRIIRYKKR